MTAIAILPRHVGAPYVRPAPKPEAPLARTGGEPPPEQEEVVDASFDIWGVHDPGQPPAVIAILAIAVTTMLGLAAWLQS